jgi:hypothetical protein
MTTYEAPTRLRGDYFSPHLATARVHQWALEDQVSDPEQLTINKDWNSVF